MQIEEIIDKLKQFPSYNKKGAQFLANLWRCSPLDIIFARKILREDTTIDSYKSGVDEEHKVKVVTKSSAFIDEEVDEDVMEKTLDSLISERRVTDDGAEHLTLVSNKPLSPKEIDQYAQVDNITSRVASYWLKSSIKGTFTYAVQVKRSISNFYTMDELQEKLKELLPEITPFKIDDSLVESDRCGILCISDIHAGAQNSALNIHGISYSEEDLELRLEKVANSLISQGKVYDSLLIANLGDSVDGWDGFTTRKGHSLGSLSNKDQFDIYFRCMTKFYTTIFQSGIANSYLVYNCLDSNHEGVDFGYICNKNVENVLSIMYPDVQFFQQEQFISVITLGNHAIALAHGKDAKIMKYPMKRTLDDRLDLWATQYFQSQGYGDHFKTLLKGDLHVFGVEQGKFGNYINVPSIYGTSDYISLNYGITRPGALFLDLDPEEDDITIKPIWV